jgi:peroxiredoxin (alkyl hydroperoxide reductase subunit C)
MLTVGSLFPAFRVKACNGPNAEKLGEVGSDSVRGRWAVYLFYPKDFTFVCPTELVDFNEKLSQFHDRDALVFGASTDNEYCHLAWCRSHDGLAKLKYPLLAAQKLAGDLGIIDPSEHVCLRATYIVDPQGVIQWVGVYNLNVGRNTTEVLRVLDALQSDELCPCNWKKGDAHLIIGPTAVPA